MQVAKKHLHHVAHEMLSGDYFFCERQLCFFILLLLLGTQVHAPLGWVVLRPGDP